ncbi:MAG: 30S ribosomal protein S20 [Ruminococcus sp.]|jgi:small subunit ribosomal protein S20|nr:30S ribosomal protein S20 [Ruminococcus sp.]
MANIKSAEKRVRIAAKNNLRNKAVKSNLRSTLKKADAALNANDGTSKEAVKAAVKKLDQAVTKGVLHKNNAARKKSKLVKLLNAQG